MVSHGIKWLLAVVALCSCLELMGQGALREGDLLFCCTDSANAITAVTTGVDDYPIDHVGIVHHIGGNDGPLYVIEAVKPAVRLTSLDRFVDEAPLVLVGRVNVDCDVNSSVRACLRLVGKPYDDLYLPGDSAVYCSELVQLCYVNNAGELLFSTIPMSFHDSTGTITDYWRQFYQQHGMSVPEGAPGTNPGELSRRPQVTILGKYPILL